MFYTECDYSDSAIDHIIYHDNELDEEAIKTYWHATKWAPMKVITKVAYSKNTLHPLPFYAVTSDTVVMFNAECEGFAFNSTEPAKHFCKQHKEINATPIVSIIHDETELLTGFAVFCGNRMRAFENILCPVGMYDCDMLTALRANCSTIAVKLFSCCGFTVQSVRSQCSTTRGIFITEKWGIS